MSHHPRIAFAALAVILSASLAEARQCLVTKLTADDARTENQFGRSVAIQGDEIFVGSPGENLAGKDFGSVQVLRRQGLGWFLEAKLTPPDGRQRLGFGTRIAADGRTLAVTSSVWSPELYVYEKTARDWNLVTMLTGPSPTVAFGCSLALRGDWIFVGAHDESTAGVQAGSVFVYQRTPLGWAPAGNLVPSDLQAGDFFGTALAAWGDWLVVGSPRADDNAGAAYVFQRSGTDWVQRQKLSGEPLDNFGGGYGIALREETLAVIGGYAAYVFEESGGIWAQVTKLAIPAMPQPIYDYAGWGQGVALTDEHVVVGSGNYPDNRVFAFRRGAPESDQAVRLQPDDMLNGTYQDRFAWTMAASGDLVLISAENSSQRASGAGAVYVYSTSGSSCATLSSPREFSWGKQRLEIDRGPEHAGHAYRLLGSLSGTSRGIPFRGTRIPLNLDRYFVALLRTPQLSLFPVSGVLDGNGRASLVLQVPPEAYPLIVGRTLDHAFLEYGPSGLEHVSNAVQVRFGSRP